MDFDLNDEQRQLKDSVERLLADSYGDLAQRQALHEGAEGLQRSASGGSTPTSACWRCRSPRSTAGSARA